MKVVTGIRITVIALVALLSACGGGGGSGNNAPDTRQLDFATGAQQRQSVSQYFGAYRYGPTQEFYQFLNENAVVVLRFPNDSFDFTMSASVVLFERSASSDAIRRWVNNQHTEGQSPIAATPSQRIELLAGQDFHIEDFDFIGRETGLVGDIYDLYEVNFRLEPHTQHERFNLSGYQGVTTVAQHINPPSNILNTALPLVENFNASNSNAFFSEHYKKLRTHSPRYAPSLLDLEPAFYYPLCCRNGEGVNENRLAISPLGLAMHNAQFTIGQLLHRFPSSELPNPKINTTEYAYNPNSWGELDLSQPYRISFCVVSSSEQGRLSLWVDNNLNEGIFGNLYASYSNLLVVNTDNLIPGQRVSVNVPGNYYLQAPHSTALGGTPAGVIQQHRGTGTSFLQLRVSDDGQVILRDLIIERQTDNTSAPACQSGT